MECVFFPGSCFRSHNILGLGFRDDRVGAHAFFVACCSLVPWSRISFSLSIIHTSLRGDRLPLHKPYQSRKYMVPGGCFERHLTGLADFSPQPKRDPTCEKVPIFCAECRLFVFGCLHGGFRFRGLGFRGFRAYGLLGTLIYPKACSKYHFPYTNYTDSL